VAGSGTVRSRALRGVSLGVGLELGASGQGVSPAAARQWRRRAQRGGAA
jgi:hypothetical protein